MSSRRSNFVRWLVAVLAMGLLTLPAGGLAAGTLAAYFPLDEAAGATTFADTSGNGYSATCSGDACPTAEVDGKIGTALQFDGNDYLEVPYAAGLNPAGSFTVAAWAKVTGGSGYRSVLTSRNGGENYQGYMFYATPTTGHESTWQFWIGTGSTWMSVGNTRVTTGVWTHLAGVYQSNTMQFYVNGQLAGSSFVSGGFSPNTQYPLRIGAGTTEGAAQFFFPGMIDDVRLYPHALTQAEVQALIPPTVTANDDTYATPEEKPLIVSAPGVLDNDSVVNGSGTVTATVVTAPSHGDLTLALDGGFVYTPTLGYTGADSFTYSANSDGVMDTASVALTVEPNVAPMAVDDVYSTVEGLPLSASGGAKSLTTGFTGYSSQSVYGHMFDVTAGTKDIHITGFDIHLSSGTHTVEVYYKAGSYVGSETTSGNWAFLGSQVVTGQGLGKPTPVEVGGLTIPTGETYGLYVTPTSGTTYMPYGNDEPVHTNADLTLTTGVRVSYSFGIVTVVGWNGTIHYTTAPSVLYNDSDANGDALTAGLDTGPSHGTLTFNADGSFIYTPTLAFLGDDTFTYTASDGKLTDTATVTITVGVNDPPAAADDTYEVARNYPISMPAPGLLANDSDPNGEPLTAALFEPPGEGTATVNLDGSFTYTPTTDFLGTDTFVYVADDGVVTNTATVTLTVLPPLCEVETTGDTQGDYGSLDAGALQAAVDAAAPDALIKVAGTCAGVQARGALTQTLYIDKSLTVQGGYTTTNGFASSDPAAYTTTLDAEQNSRFSAGEGRVVYITSGVTVTLDGLILTGGHAEEDRGGGIYSEGALTVSDSILQDNAAGEGGGGIYIAGATLAVSHSAFYTNTAGWGSGGGIFGESAAVTLNDVLFETNGSNYGGGVAVENGSLEITGSTFRENWAEEGGAILTVYSPLTLTHSFVYTNTTDEGCGGGVSSYMSPVTLDTVWVQGNDSGNTGGGVCGINGTLSVTNSTFLDNDATRHGYYGGAIGVYSNPLTVTQSTFYTNTGYYGGAIYGIDSSISLDDASLRENAANEYGGGVYSTAGTLYVTSSIFEQNRGWHGGGIYAWNPVTVEHSSFYTNTSNGSGGGIYNRKAYLALADVLFQANEAGAGGAGGGVYSQSGMLNVTRGEFRYNHAGNHGGGIHVYDSPATVDNSLFYSNTATYGGGFYPDGSDAVLTNVTFYDNHASNSGGGIYNQSGALTLANGILWDNQDAGAGTTAQVENAGGTVTVTYSLVQGAPFPGTGNLDVDPKFVDAAAGDFHLQEGSPAVDAGDNVAVTAADDLDRNPRIMNGKVDMGAYEFREVLALTKSVTPTVDVAYHGAVTYTLVLENLRTVNEVGIVMTDTLPTNVELGGWINSPAGTVHAGKAITWTGDLASDEQVTLVFTATHTGAYGDVITNTAYFSGTKQKSSAAATFNVVNNAPALDPIGDQTVAEGETLSFTVSASDPDGTTPTLGATDLPTGAVFTVTTGAFTWTPDFDAADTYTVTFSASDGLLTDTETIYITVLNTNRSPALDPVGDRTVAEGETLSFTVSASDPDGTTPTLGATDLPTGAVFTVTTGAFTWTPDFDAADTYTVTFSASDGTLSDTEKVIIDVTDTNRAPVLDPVGDKTVAEGETLSFTVSASDPDGTTPTLGATDLPTGAVFTPTTGAFAWTPDFDAADTYTVTFSASDGLLTDTEKVIIDVTNSNRAPVLDPVGDKTVAEGETLSFTVSASDPDGTTPTLGATDLPTGAVFTPTTGAFAWTPGFDAVGTYTVTFSASDGTLSDTETITITVSNVDTNHAPVADAGVDQQVAPESTVTLDGSGSYDPDGDALTYLWVQTGGPAVTFTSALSVTTFTSPADASVLTFTLTVTDAAGLYDSDGMVVTVRQSKHEVYLPLVARE